MILKILLILQKNLLILIPCPKIDFLVVRFVGDLINIGRVQRRGIQEESLAESITQMRSAWSPQRILN